MIERHQHDAPAIVDINIMRRNLTTSRTSASPARSAIAIEGYAHERSHAWAAWVMLAGFLGFLAWIVA